jgi:hypothetical protein
MARRSSAQLAYLSSCSHRPWFARAGNLDYHYVFSLVGCDRHLPAYAAQPLGIFDASGGNAVSYACIVDVRRLCSHGNRTAVPDPIVRWMPMLPRGLARVHAVISRGVCSTWLQELITAVLAMVVGGRSWVFKEGESSSFPCSKTPISRSDLQFRCVTYLPPSLLLCTTRFPHPSIVHHD